VADGKETPDKVPNTLKDDIFDSMYGSITKLRENVKNNLVADMRKNLISVLGLVGFKLVTQIYAKEGSSHIEDDHDRLHKSRMIKETIRSRVIDEWKTVGPTEAMRRTRSHMDQEFSSAFPDALLEELTQEAIKEIDQWVRQALDMTPTAEDLFESLTMTPKEEPEPDED
jgi:hypothetical protein